MTPNFFKFTNKKFVLLIAATSVVAITGLVMALQAAAQHGGAQSGSSAAVATTTVSISDLAFKPSAIKIKAGDTVTWTNDDSMQHSIVADTISNDAPNSRLLSQGQSYSFTFATPGTYDYHCQQHPSMLGSVIVE